MQLNRFKQIFVDQVDSPKLKNDKHKTIVIQMLNYHETANPRDFYQTQNL